jgi:methylmalonyl-CoA mutase
MNEVKAEPADSNSLFGEFPEPSYEQWRAEAEKALKGASFESKLITQTYEGIALQPIYSPLNLSNSNLSHSLPGSWPFIRGTRAGGYLTTPWLIAQVCDQAMAIEVNAVLKNELSRGLKAIHLQLDTATLAGEDPDCAEADRIGDQGFSLVSLADLTQALAGLDLKQWPVLIQCGVSQLPVAALLAGVARAQGIELQNLSGAITMDPLGLLSQQGYLPAELETLYDEMAAVTLWADRHAPQLKTILADASPYHDAGGNAVQELAFALATAVEYVNKLQERGVAFSVISRHLRFSFSLGANMFMELAKIRAARVLWSQVAEAFGGNETDCRANIHGRTSRFTKTIYDPYVNMLRTTTEAFAGVAGGLDSLYVGPFDEVIRPSDEFSRRIARNTQIMLQQECSLLLPVDPAGGSWYVEALTEELAYKAWELFRKTEAYGGMLQAVQAGFPQDQVAATAQKRAANLAKRRDAVVGTNVYANLTEKPLEQPVINPEDIRSVRIRELSSFRSVTDIDQRMLCLERLAEQRNNLTEKTLESAVQAVTAGCTIGEILAALRQTVAAPLTVMPLRLHRLAELYETVRLTTEHHVNQGGENLKIFLANMGPIPQHKPELTSAVVSLRLAVLPSLAIMALMPRQQQWQQLCRSRPMLWSSALPMPPIPNLCRRWPGC